MQLTGSYRLQAAAVTWVCQYHVSAEDDAGRVPLLRPRSRCRRLRASTAAGAPGGRPRRAQAPQQARHAAGGDALDADAGLEALQEGLRGGGRGWG